MYHSEWKHRILRVYENVAHVFVCNALRICNGTAAKCVIYSSLCNNNLIHNRWYA